ncbi:MAG: DAK2 domain-containing protein [Clostridiales bacterium]|nr:DAK2 domain-containing protein [Clostridiales bacterium]
MLYIDGQDLKKLILAGAQELNNNKDFIDSLNVFPVPDGDTGTNMSLTILSSVDTIKNIENKNINEIAKKASMGALKGARGNSGVILSQLFRGFYKSLENLEKASLKDIAEACKKASEFAYSAVMRPKEGTILTMSREIANKIFQESIDENISLEKVLLDTIIYGHKILIDSKELLPALKQADVVDSGARGLLFILEGMLKYLSRDSDFEISLEKLLKKEKNSDIKNISKEELEENIRFGYCTELFLNIKDGNKSDDEINELKEYLEKIGDSLVFVNDDGMIKIHVHSNNPGLVLEKSLEIGDIDDIKIENMRLQNKKLTELNKINTKKNIGFISVVSGNGFSDIFKELGVDEIVDAGYSFNPSTQDILDAIKKVNADNIFILPNNKNTTLASQQACNILRDSEKKVCVIETESMPEGIDVLINYIDNSDDNIDIACKKIIETNFKKLVIEVSLSIREVKTDNLIIKTGDILCLTKNNIISSDKFIDVAIEKMFNLIINNKNNDYSVTNIYFGNKIKKNEAEKMIESLKSKYKDLEMNLYFGGQETQFYIISIE